MSEQADLDPPQTALAEDREFALAAACAIASDAELGAAASLLTGGAFVWMDCPPLDRECIIWADPHSFTRHFCHDGPVDAALTAPLG